MYATSDIIIAVMGPTGAGKTTFVNKVAGSSFTIGYGLESETQAIQTAECWMNGQHVRLIDTPGFDDTDRTDTQILDLIANHLASAYRSGCRLSGILYFHRITDNRVGGVSSKNMRIFQKLCGDSAMSSVVLCTTMWGQVPEHVGAQRENELVANFWQVMVRKGAMMRRVLDSRESASEIITSLINLHRPVTLQIQQEIVDQGKPISATEAARDLNREKEEARLRLEAELARVRQEAQQRLAEEQRRWQEELARQRRENEARLAREAEQRRIEEQQRQAEISRLQHLQWQAEQHRHHNDGGCVIF